MCGGGAVNTYLRKQYIEPQLAKQKAAANVGRAKNPSAKGKADGKAGGTRQTSKSGNKGTDRRGSLIGGGRKELAGGKDKGNLGRSKLREKKTLLGA